MSNLRLGIEVLRQTPSLAKDWGNCALLCNQASVADDFSPSWYICQDILGKRLAGLFSPQHGFEATVQDNMIETANSIHIPTGLPIYSLYQQVREPTTEMLRGLDTLIVDLQISGTRVYTFKYTLAGMLRAAVKHGLQVVVLDRPNPLGGEVLEGRVLDLAVRSFVGEYPLPMRHGLTVGEFAQFCNREVGAQLQVISMHAWQPAKLWSELGREWVLTSPNLPNFSSLLLYCGTVIFEGTNISEGRGTCLPFQLIGAPFLNSRALAARTAQLYAAAETPIANGYFLRPTQFMPVAQKWQQQVCEGVQVHWDNKHSMRPFTLALALLRACIELGADEFAWKQPPYEYEYHKLPIQLLLGSTAAAELLTADKFACADAHWHAGLDAYRRKVGSSLLYQRQMLV
ncbi:MAG: DUF1343 domain-containing protein [Pseudomonadota bacterium]|nr:DUF1343 domain-containing protein [Pseudomonadota bacterium]